MEEVAPVSEETVEQSVEPAEVQEETTEESTEVEESQPETEEAEASNHDDEVSTDGEEAKPERKQTAQDRIQQLANERKELREKVEALEARFNESQQQIPKVDEERLNNYLGELRDEIDTLRLEGNHLEADKKERQRDKLIDEYEKYTEESVKQQKQRESQNEQRQRMQADAKRVDDAAAFYAKENNIPADVFREMGQKWQEMITSDQLLARKFWEKYQYSGPISAIEYAHSEVNRAIEQSKNEVAQEKDKREEGKNKQPSVAPAPIKGVKTFADLMSKGSKAVTEYKKQNPQHYARLLNAAMKN